MADQPQLQISEGDVQSLKQKLQEWIPTLTDGEQVVFGMMLENMSIPAGDTQGYFGSQVGLTTDLGGAVTRAFVPSGGGGLAFESRGGLAFESRLGLSR